jgi:hypothetical protein
MSEIRLWSATQNEAFDGLKTLWDQRRALDADAAAYAGGMQWKVVKDRTYLVRHQIDPATGQRRFESLGVRSPKTEAIADRFVRGREALQKKGAQIDERLRVQGAVAKAAKVGHTPLIVGDVFRALSVSPACDHVALSGSLALLAYETQARASVPSDLFALPDNRADLDLFVGDVAIVDEVESVLQSVDRAFHREGHGGRRFICERLSVDIYTGADLAAIGEQFYRGRHQAKFLDAAQSAPVESCIVDRSGAIAPVCVLSIENFRALKALRTSFDDLRADADLALDARQAEAAGQIIDMISRPSDHVSVIDENEAEPWAPRF